MISEEELDILEKELNVANATEEVQEIFGRIKDFILKKNTQKEKYKKKRQTDPYQKKMNRLSNQIWYARKNQDKEKLEKLTLEYEELKEIRRKAK